MGYPLQRAPKNIIFNPFVGNRRFGVRYNWCPQVVSGDSVRARRGTPLVVVVVVVATVVGVVVLPFKKGEGLARS